MENAITISLEELEELINNDLAVFEAQLYALLRAWAVEKEDLHSLLFLPSL